LLRELRNETKQLRLEMTRGEEFERFLHHLVDGNGEPPLHTRIAQHGDRLSALETWRTNVEKTLNRIFVGTVMALIVMVIGLIANLAALGVVERIGAVVTRPASAEAAVDSPRAAP
jgi:hypothetical protein